jgi:hypothetical protein
VELKTALARPGLLFAAALLLLTCPAAGQGPFGRDPGYLPGSVAARDLCQSAEAFRRTSDVHKAPAPLAIDGDLNTGVLIRSDQAPVEIRFVGHPPWVSSVIVHHDAELDFELRGRDIYKTEIEIDFEADKLLTGDGFATTSFQHRGVWLTSLILAPSDDAEGRIYEVEAYFDDFDTDDGRNEFGIEYVQNYRGSACGGYISPVAHWDAYVFGQELQYLLGWDRNFFFGNELALEVDFDEANDLFVDDVDLVYFTGMGWDDLLWFRGVHLNDESCQLHSEEVYQEWGDVDLEWIILNSSRTLSGDCPWCESFYGLHGIMGFRSKAWGLRFYTRGTPALLDGWIWKYPSLDVYFPVWSVFKSAVYFSYGVLGRFDIVGVFAYSIRDREYLWGGGGVHYDDPLPGHGHWVVRMDESSYPCKNSANIDLTSKVAIGSADGTAPRISIVADLADRVAQRSDTLYRLIVQHRTVDQAYASDLADSFCLNYGFFCERDQSHNVQLGTYEIYDGPHVLTVFEATGGWHYVRADLGTIHGDFAPDLLEESEVQPASEALWGHFGGLPADTVHLGPGYMKSSLYDNSGMLVPDSSWHVDVSMAYTRFRNGMPIIGPGAGMQAVFGDGEAVHSIYHGGWREVVEGEPIQTITAQEAIDNIASSGYDVTFFGVPHHDELVIWGADLGYYEPAVDSVVDELQPIWILRSFCILESDTGQVDIVVSAEHLNPVATIVMPENDTTINEGEVLTLSGDATGEPPFAYTWYSDVDGCLDTGQVVTVSSLSAVCRDGTNYGHIITLEVADGNGMIDYDVVSVTVLREYVCGDADASSGVDIDDVVYLIAYIFSGGPEPVPYESGDADCVGGVDIDDVVYLIAFIFLGGPEPCDPDGDGMLDC